MFRNLRVEKNEKENPSDPNISLTGFPCQKGQVNDVGCEGYYLFGHIYNTTDDSQPSISYRSQEQRQQDEEENLKNLNNLTTNLDNDMENLPTKTHINTNKIFKLNRQILCGRSKSSGGTIITQESDVTNNGKFTIERVNEKMQQLEVPLPNPSTETKTTIINYVHLNADRGVKDITRARDLVITDSKPTNKTEGVNPATVVIRKPKRKLEAKKLIVEQCDPEKQTELCADDTQIIPSNTEIITLNDNTSFLKLKLNEKVPIIQLDNNSLQHKGLIENIRISDRDQNYIQSQPDLQIKTNDNIQPNSELPHDPIKVNAENILIESVSAVAGKQSLENAMLLNSKRNYLRKVLNESKITTEKETNNEEEIDVTSIDITLDKIEDKQYDDISEIKKIETEQVVQEVREVVYIPTENQAVIYQSNLAQEKLSAISTMVHEQNTEMLNNDFISSSANNQEEKLNKVENMQDTIRPLVHLKGTKMVLTKVQSKELKNKKRTNIDKNNILIQTNNYLPVATSVQTLDEQEIRKAEKRCYNMIEHDYCDLLGQHREYQSTQNCLHEFVDNATQNNMQLEEILSNSIPCSTSLPIITSVISITEDLFAKKTDHQDKNIYKCNDDSNINQNIEDYTSDDFGQRNILDQSSEFENTLEEINDAPMWSDQRNDQTSSINDDATLSLVKCNEETVSADTNAIHIAATLSLVKSNEENVSTDTNAIDITATLSLVTSEESGTNDETDTNVIDISAASSEVTYNEETVSIHSNVIDFEITLSDQEIISIDSMSSECEVVDDFDENNASIEDTPGFVNEVCIRVSRR